MLRHREAEDEILELLFGYLNFLRGLPAWPQDGVCKTCVQGNRRQLLWQKELLAENLQLSEAAWASRETDGPMEATVQLAGNMQAGVLEDSRLLFTLVIFIAGSVLSSPFEQLHREMCPNRLQRIGNFRVTICGPARGFGTGQVWQAQWESIGIATFDPRC